MLSFLMIMGLMGPVEVAIHPSPHLACGVERAVLSLDGTKFFKEISPVVGKAGDRADKNTRLSTKLEPSFLSEKMKLVLLEEVVYNGVTPLCEKKDKRYLALWSIKTLNGAWSVAAPWEQGE